MQNLRIRDPGPVRGGGRQAISAEWANRMRDCVMALARVIPQQTRKPTEWTPKKPFEVTANGDDTVTVAPGNVIDFTTTGNGIYDSNAVTGDFNAYAGGDVTITASGTLFLVITYDNTNLIAQDTTFDLATFALTVTSMAVELDPTLSSLELSIPIAEVELTDSVASVTNQILTHNPILQLGFAEGLTP